MQIRILPLALLALTSVAAAQVPTHDDVVIGQVALDAGGSVPLFADVYLPTNAGPTTPCLVWIHGGGWATGSHNGMPTAIQRLLDSGVALVSAGYRLSDQAIFPAQIHDVKGVVRHVRANAALYHIDPSRIACWGASAGGHLAALLATTGDDPALEGTSGGNAHVSSRVMAAVDYSGPTDLLMTNPDVIHPQPGCYLDHDAPDSYNSRLIGFDGPNQGIGALRNNLDSAVSPFPEMLALVQQANPITHLTLDDAPIFIAHGVIDTIIPTAQSSRLHLAALAIGLPSVMKIDPNHGHGSLDGTTYAATRSFLLERFHAGHTAGVAYCFGDQSGAACPCGNASAPTAYEGCQNSTLSGGRLRAEGRSTMSFDSLTLFGTRMPNSSTVYVKGMAMNMDGVGSALSDGLMCISGPFIRLGTKFNVNGASRFPASGDAKISTLGGGVAPGTTHYFQAIYRDEFEFCQQHSFNLTNGVAVTFTP